ncbi:YibE/F family protein [Mycolicibacterium moriokaense]|nr:YibE/F family protein [Mycolicibacterium moriokaense]
MTHSHAHSHTLNGPSPLGPLAAKAVVGILIAIGVAVVAGAALLWPSQEKVDIPLPFQNAAGGAVTTETGSVLATGKADCGGPDVGAVITRSVTPAQAKDGPCVHTLVTITSGPNADATTVLEFSNGPGQPTLAAGDHIRLSRQVDQSGTTTYAFYDYERTWPLIALAVGFAVVIVAVARWRGLRALFGIVVAFLVLVVFLLPALRDGAPAIPVALVASAAILYAVIYLAHGVSLRTSAALLGTLTSLLLAALLSWGAIEFAHLTGLSEDQNNEIAAYMGQVSITGLLLAGFIIGSLGVLNDVTVTQASTVFELAEAGDGSSRRAIFLGAMRVGRDHIASTVYTLVLAYAGSALPLLLLFSVANRSLGDVLTSETVAIEIARSAVGGIALALSVPLTTAIAAVLARPGAASVPAARAGRRRIPT